MTSVFKHPQAHQLYKINISLAASSVPHTTLPIGPQSLLTLSPLVTEALNFRHLAIQNKDCLSQPLLQLGMVIRLCLVPRMERYCVWLLRHVLQRKKLVLPTLAALAGMEQPCETEAEAK